MLHTFNSSAGLYREFRGYKESPSQTRRQQIKIKPQKISSFRWKSSKTKQENPLVGAGQSFLEQVEATLLSGFLLGLHCVLCRDTERETKARVNQPAPGRYVDLGTDSVYLVWKWRAR